MDTRLIVDEPARGSWNMAVDDALLQSVGQGSSAALRFYQWETATLSLGYFQRLATRDEHPASSHLPVVRRGTGGGAIVHDRELTYSFATPIRNRFSTEAKDLVQNFHQSLISTLNDFGVHARFCGEVAPESSTEPFLCFQRRNSLDILIGCNKVVGSAQRTRHGVLLQHGSIVLGRSRFAEELPGICDLTDAESSAVSIDPQELTTAWSNRLSEQIGLSLQASTLTDREETLAVESEQKRFTHRSWTEKR